MTDSPDPPPRGLPARVPLRGQHVVLEPLHPRHVPDLWLASREGDPGWTFLPFGPFAGQADMARHVAEAASRHDPMVWAVRPVATGQASGVLALANIRPRDASVELADLWFASRLRRTRAATEAMFLLLRLVADDLGYRRLVWSCDAGDAAARAAALRLGFVPEGVMRQDRMLGGRARDTVVHSILAAEWPGCRDALLRWLDPANFGPDGTALHGLAELREAGGLGEG